MTLQTLAVGMIVAVAAAWLAWRLVLPAAWQVRARARIGRPTPRQGCGCARDPLG